MKGKVKTWTLDHKVNIYFHFVLCLGRLGDPDKNKIDGL